MAVERIKRALREKRDQELVGQAEIEERNRKWEQERREREARERARAANEREMAKRVLMESGVHPILEQIYNEFVRGKYSKHDLARSSTREILVWGKHYRLGRESDEVFINYERAPFLSDKLWGWLDCNTVTVMADPNGLKIIYKEEVYLPRGEFSRLDEVLAQAFLSPRSRYHDPYSYPQPSGYTGQR